MNTCDHGVNPKYCRACKKQRETPNAQATGELSDFHIENWRKVLHGMIGPYALIMPVKEIDAFRDKMIGDINDLTTPEE
jgi:hypothetical protein